MNENYWTTLQYLLTKDPTRGLDLKITYTWTSIQSRVSSCLYAQLRLQFILNTLFEPFNPCTTIYYTPEKLKTTTMDVDLASCIP